MLSNICIDGDVMRDAPKSLHMHLSYAGLQALKNAQNSNVLDAQNFSENDVTQFVAGVQKYQNHSFVVPDKNRTVVWKEGGVTVQRKEDVACADDAPIVLLVPSLINDAEIFDILPHQSFFGFLGEENIRSFLLDWGDVGSDEVAVDLEYLAQHRLVVALRFLYEQYQRPVHVLGYCLGGVLASMAVLTAPDCVASLTCLATPWDFEAGEGTLRSRVQFFFQRPDIHLHLQTRDLFLADWMHSVLATLNPDIVVQKFIRFAAMDGGVSEELFVAVEDWLASSVDLKMSLARDICEGLIIGNDAQQRISAQDIACPVLVVASQKDKLVEFECAKMLRDHVQHSELIVPSCGHIGMMAGRHARAEIWQPFLNWVRMHS